jgi:uncharacterized DUF497 family protein
MAGLGFDYDGNRRKRQKHGLSTGEIQFVVSQPLIVPRRMGSELLDAVRKMPSVKAFSVSAISARLWNVPWRSVSAKASAPAHLHGA